MVALPRRRRAKSPSDPDAGSLNIKRYSGDGGRRLTALCSRRRRWLCLLAGHLTVLAVLAGCGGGDGTPDQPATELDITVWAGGRSGDKDEASLRCGPPGGSLASPEEACRRLDQMKRPFARPSDQVVCTEIYGGPALAEIRGTFNGEEVDTTFARTDGCEIALWDRHQFLFPVQPASP